MQSDPDLVNLYKFKSTRNFQLLPRNIEVHRTSSAPNTVPVDRIDRCWSSRSEEWSDISSLRRVFFSHRDVNLPAELLRTTT